MACEIFDIGKDNETFSRSSSELQWVIVVDIGPIIQKAKDCTQRSLLI